MPDEPTIICGVREGLCECVRQREHDGPHECDSGCGGSWDFDDDGRFVFVAPPRPGGAGRGRPVGWSA